MLICELYKEEETLAAVSIIFTQYQRDWVHPINAIYM